MLMVSPGTVLPLPGNAQMNHARQQSPDLRHDYRNETNAIVHQSTRETKAEILQLAKANKAGATGELACSDADCVQVTASCACCGDLRPASTSPRAHRNVLRLQCMRRPERGLASQVAGASLHGMCCLHQPCGTRAWLPFKPFGRLCP